MLSPATPDAQQIVEAVSAVLQLAVTLVNDQLVRTAGTGPYLARVGEQLHPDSAFGQALATGRAVQVMGPRTDPVCQRCSARPTCTETAHLAHPLLDEGVAVGVLGFIAFTPEEREQILHGLDRYVDFLSKISHLLMTKLKEEKTARALLAAQGSLQAVADSVTEGLIATDATGAVTFINGAARQMLHLPPTAAPAQIGELPGLAQAVDEVLGDGRGIVHRELTIRTGEGSLRVVGNIQPIRIGGRVAGSVSSLRHLDEVYDLAYRLHADQPALGLDQIVHHSEQMVDLVSRVQRVATSSATVLIRGESGTGKELVARALHAGSPRRDGPFIALNCAAIPEELLESELFGYADGAFTGARRGGKPGKFELAHGGTLFLDEIGDMSLRLQAKLLRVLQEAEVTRLGGTQPIRLDVRMVAATHQDLERLMAQREFRADLFYRLSVIPLEIPPLRERPADILPLVAHFRSRHARLTGQPQPRFAPSTEAILLGYRWPGNVRELENVVAYALTMGSGPLLDVDALPPRLLAKGTEQRVLIAPAAAPTTDDAAGPLVPLTELERRELQRGLARYGSGDRAVTRIGRELGISRATVYRRLKEYGLLDGSGT